VDIIGVDATFPLTQSSTPPVSNLLNAWQGAQNSSGLASDAINNGNVFAKLRQLHITYDKSILFTGAGYESVGGANEKPGYAASIADPQGQTEQQNDMDALLRTFEPESWWLGVVWTLDYPIWPRSSLATVAAKLGGLGLDESDWPSNMQWAGDCYTACP